MKSPKIHLSTPSNPKTSENTSLLAPKLPSISAASITGGHKSVKDIENDAFAQQQIEVTKLKIQAKYGTITPEGQEHLTVLQASMDGLLNSRLEKMSQFSHNIANIPLTRPDRLTPIQAKLTIGEPWDKYEQEADETARQVVQRIHQPQNNKLQPEELLQNEELQMKPMVQRMSDGGMAASPDLETSIQQAKGSGQSLAKRIREPMEQAFGADFSGVKVHTDTQADQLNQSIQAKAFTTGQDVFFSSGAYKPSSRSGQELLAHELTHVVQQSMNTIQSQQQSNTVNAQIKPLSDRIEKIESNKDSGELIQGKVYIENRPLF
ncbi:MAG: DUF4157 domain-containing protein [Nostoc sp.]|uniref:eCIS core domain-containing protein n=1 Tax=Nostoc sp. TaxID=1180 RepID=UPI002FFC0867